MSTKVRRIALDKLLPHPDNPNRMSRATFAKLVRNIKLTDRYEPLVVRPHPQQHGCFQIVNGHHRCYALKKLGHKTADAVVWDVDDEQTDILLTTLNRLTGRDSLDKKLALLRRLNDRIPTRNLAKLVPQTRGQLERLIHLMPLSKAMQQEANAFVIPLVFFVGQDQKHAIEEALLLAETARAKVDSPSSSNATTRAARRAAALTHIANEFLDYMQQEQSNE
jgi:ParB/RepB/Spo0J family partition protein